MASQNSTTVSICLPVFNGEQFLTQAIQSVLNQTYEDFELLVSDDCSADGSFALVERFARNDARIKLARSTGQRGVFANYNECISRSAGAYIKFFAQDDVLHPTHLERCVAVLAECPEVTLVSTRRNWIDELNRDITHRAATPSTTSLLPGNTQIAGHEAVRRSLTPIVNFIGEPAAVTIRSHSRGCGFDTSFHHLGDLDYWLRILLTGDYYFIDEVLCSFRVHERSETRRNTRGLFFAPDLLKLGQKFASTLRALGCSEQTFHSQTIRALAAHMEHLSGTEQLSLADLRSTSSIKQQEDGEPSSKATLADMLAFRELALHALLEVHSLSSAPAAVPPVDAPKAAAPEPPKLLQTADEQIIFVLERRLRSLLGSSSWRNTRILRDLNRPTRVSRSPGTKLPAVEELVNRQTYVSYLRDSIRRVRNSRSWKLTSPLRMLGLYDKSLAREETHLICCDVHPLFDAAYYLERNPDAVVEAGADPLVHYVFHGANEGRDPHPLFDSSFYLEQNPDVAQFRINPLLHYCQDGAWEGRNPHVLFDSAFYMKQDPDIGQCGFNPLIHYLRYGGEQRLDPHPLFDTAYYLNQLPAAAGKPGNPLLHYLTLGAAQGFNPSAAFDGNSYWQRYPDVAAAGVNPLWHYLSLGLAEGKLGRKIDSIAGGALSFRRPEFQTALAELRGSTRHKFSHLIVLGVLTRGGAERSACSYVKAIAEREGLGNILVLVTDETEMTCADWLPAGTAIVNLLQLETSLSVEERAMMLLDLIARARPSVTFGVNSLTFWSGLDCHAEVCRKELSTRFVAYLGGYETFVTMNDWGFNHGPISRLVDYIDLFVTDNVRLRNTMVSRYGHVPAIQSKVVSCYKSLTTDLHESLSFSPPAPDLPSPRIVLWASRLDRIKQPEVLAQIASRMPNVSFEVFGRESPGTDISCLRSCGNITLKGEYSDFSAIPRANKAVFLHTSLADSMPNVLLEAAACGLPIIAPDIGAISELISYDSGWLIAPCDDVAAYVQAIRYVLDHPQEARERAAVAQKLVNERHQWSAFRRRVNQLDIFAQPLSASVATKRLTAVHLER